MGDTTSHCAMQPEVHGRLQCAMLEILHQLLPSRLQLVNGICNAPLTSIVHFLLAAGGQEPDFILVSRAGKLLAPQPVAEPEQQPAPALAGMAAGSSASFGSAASASAAPVAGASQEAIKKLEFKRRGEELLRQSGLGYTIIRPGAPCCCWIEPHSASTGCEVLKTLVSCSAGDCRLPSMCKEG